MVSGEVFDPFSSRGILESTNLLPHQDDAWKNLKHDAATEYLHLSEVEKPHLIDLHAESSRLQIPHEKLPVLNTNNDDDDGEATASPSSGGSSSQTSVITEIDIWALNAFSLKAVPKKLLTWDDFKHPERAISDQKYPTETTGREFDRFQAQLYHSEHKRPLRFAENDAFQQALSNLVFGRSSAFFKWSREASQFEFAVHDLAISGCSQAASAEICEYFVIFGSRFRRLQDYSHMTTHSHPTQYAFQRSLEKMLHFVELQATISRGQHARCIRVLEEAEKMTDLLSSLEQLTKASESSESEQNFLTSFVRKLDQLWVSNNHLKPILAVLLSDVAGPAIQQTREMIGLLQQAKIIEDQVVWLFAKLLPDLAKPVVDVKASLAIFNYHSSSMAISESDMPIYLAHSWAGVIDLQDSASAFEERSRIQRADVAVSTGVPFQLNTIKTPASSNPFSIDFDLVAPTGLSTAVNAQHVQESGSSIPREIAHLLSGTTSEAISELSPVQTVQLSLRPFVEAQHRLTSYGMLKALLVQHELKSHLDTLHAFFLFGSGSFAVRLVTALFDSSQENIEGRRKSGLTGGLRLEDREVWPPASSELRLALNGILSESMQSVIPPRILDRVSFAIKELSDEEAELRRNTHSIHALDFLRVTYLPSDAMLETVITPSILDNYDRIFSFMLIILRVHSLCQGLMLKIVKSGSSRCSVVYNRLCMEANHFMTTFLAFAMHNAIHSPWRAFNDRISTVYHHVRANDYQETMNAAKSVSQLCQDHADAVDDTLKGLLLHKKQSEAFGLTRDLLNLLLEFSSDVENASNTVRTNGVYNAFRRLREKWYRSVQAICGSTNDPALQRLQILLWHMDLSGTLGLSDRPSMQT